MKEEKDTNQEEKNMTENDIPGNNPNEDYDYEEDEGDDSIGFDFKPLFEVLQPVAEAYINYLELKKEEETKQKLAEEETKKKEFDTKLKTELENINKEFEKFKLSNEAQIKLKIEETKQKLAEEETKKIKIENELKSNIENINKEIEKHKLSKDIEYKIKLEELATELNKLQIEKEIKQVETKRDILIQLINVTSITAIFGGILFMIFKKGFNSDYVSFMVIAAWVIYSYAGNSNFLKFGNKKDK